MNLSFKPSRLRPTAFVVALVVSLVVGPLTAPSSASGGASLVIAKWDVDYATGKVTYDVGLDVTDAAAPGGPCAGYCDWRIEMWYRNERRS